MRWSVLLLGIPDLTQEYENAFSGDQKIRCELYAFMSWNFYETVCDKQDKELLRTWSIIIESESQLHAKWFENPSNTTKFKSSFREYVARL